MKNATLNYENTFFLEGTALSGVLSVDGSYNIDYKPINVIGQGFVKQVISSIPTAELSLSRYLVSNDPVLNLTGQQSNFSAVPVSAGLYYKNKYFAFEKGYSIHKSHLQSLTSLLTIPIFGGVYKVPSWTDFKYLEEIQTMRKEDVDAQEQFAEWILAMLIPWPKINHSYKDVNQPPCKRLLKIFIQLNKGTFLLSENGQYYQGPPGYEEKTIMRDSPDGNAFNFTQHNLAILIARLARGLKKPPKEFGIIASMFRGRNSQYWKNTDPEAGLFPKEYLHNQKIDYYDRAGDGAEFGYETNDNLIEETDNEKALFDFCVSMIENLKSSQNEFQAMGQADDDSKSQSMKSFINQFKTKLDVVAMEKDQENDHPAKNSSNFSTFLKSQEYIPSDTCAHILNLIRQDPEEVEEIIDVKDAQRNVINNENEENVTNQGRAITKLI